MKFFKHLKVVLKHKWWVFKLCRMAGIPWRGLIHDLSKFTPTELIESVKYFHGHRSPLAVCKETEGYSKAWLHHKGRNKHHFEYWMDFSKASGGMVGCRMPIEYVVEMVMDRIAACKVYRGKNYTDASAWEYYQRERPYLKGAMNPETQRLLEKILIMLRDKGERATFAYLRKLLKSGDYPRQS